jgi:hypothetical protein
MKKITLLALILGISAPIFGQQKESVELPNQPQNAIALVPQYAIVHGIRIDYEKRIKNGNNWVVFAPQIYTDVDGSNSWTSGYASYESMTGMGLNVYFKSIAYKSDKINWRSGLPRTSLYLQAGPSYQHFSLRNTEEVAVPYVEDGTTYYQFDTQEVKKPINRFGAVVDVGWQLAFDRFLIDTYLGLAVKYSYDQNGELIRTSSGGWGGRDYSGIYMDGGFRLGMFF